MVYFSVKLVFIVRVKMANALGPFQSEDIRLNMTEKLFTGTLNHYQNKTK